MSAELDELRELVDALPEERVEAALADVRRHLAVVPDVTWLPEWFGMGQGLTPRSRSPPRRRAR